MNGGGPSGAWLQGAFPVLDPSWGAPAAPPLAPAAHGLPPPVTLESAIGAANAGAPAPVAPAAPPMVESAPVSFPQGPNTRHVPPTPPAAPPTVAPPAQVAAPAQPAAAAPEEPARPDVEFRQVGGGGMTPAREVATRGPQQSALLERSFEHPLSAADRIEERSARQAQRESEMYDAQAEEWLNQKQAMDRVAARREQEMAGLRSDYANTIQQLGTMKVDNDRLWANSSTGEKIGALALGFVGGIFSQGTENKIQKALDKRIEDDVKAQMFDYQKGLDIAKAQQTAFGMAMDQFGSEDAAYHAARGAAQQYTAARMGSLAAEWKGTESANRADELRAKYQEEADKSAAAGFAYLQPKATAPQFALSVRGQRAPGLFSQDKAQAAFFEHGIKPSEKVDEEVVKGGIAARLEALKLRAQQTGKADDWAKFISTQEQAAKLPGREAVIADARTKHANAPRTTAERAAEWFLGIDYQSSPGIYKSIFGKDAAEREQAWSGVIAEKRHELAGANVTPEEAKPIMAALQGANDQESRMAALKLSDEVIARERANIRGAAKDSGSGYDANRGGIPQGAKAPGGLHEVGSFKAVK